MMTQHSAAAQEHQSRFSWAVAPSDCHQLHKISSTCNLKTSSVFTWFLSHKSLRWNDYLLASTVRYRGTAQLTLEDRYQHAVWMRDMCNTWNPRKTRWIYFTIYVQLNFNSKNVRRILSI